MPPTWTRSTTLALLLVFALTSLPARVLVFGQCPCGCLPEALVVVDLADLEDSADPAAPRDRGQHSDSPRESHGCHGCVQPLPYCPTESADFPVSVSDCSDTLRPDGTSELPSPFVLRLIRPPRA